MLIENIHIENFRTIKGPLELNFGPGLNVLHGSNETGKSTLVDALFTLLTVKATATGAIQRDIRPRDGSIAFIRVVLSHGGARYTIAKKFSGTSGTTRLQIRFDDGRAEDLSSDAAEARLRTLLGIEYKTANARGQPIALGLLPLLFVRQGEGTMEPSAALGSSGQVSLTSRLAAEAGSVLAGTKAGLFEPGSDRVLERAKRERDRYFQDTSDHWRRTSSPIGDASSVLEKAKEEADRLRARAGQLEAALDRHARTRASLRDLGARILGLAAEANTAAERLAEARRLLARSAHQRLILAARETEVAKISEWLEQRACLSRSSADAERMLGGATSALEALRASAEIHNEGCRVSSDKVEARRRSSREAERRCLRAAEHLRSLEAKHSLEDLDERRTAAAEIIARMARIETQRAQGVEREKVEELERLQRALERSELAISIVSASVRIKAERDVALAIDGKPVKLSSCESIELRARATTSLRIEDLVQVTIEPGSVGLAELDRKAVEDRSNVQSALSACGCASIAEARSKMELRRDADLEINASRRELALLVPEGIETIDRRRTESTAQRLAADQRVVALTDDADDVLPGDLDAASSLVSSLDHLRSALAREVVEKERELHEEALGRERQRAELASREAERRAAKERLDEYRNALARSLEQHGADAMLSAMLVTAQAERDDAQRLLEESERALSAIDAAAAELEAERTEHARTTAQGEIERLRREEAKLCGELQSADVIGLHERLEDASSREAEAEANLERIKIDAEAARLLYDTLRAARDEARRKYLAPLRVELESSLALLFPGARVVLDDQFTISQLDRPSEGVDAFPQLSFGTREQLAILTRLAFAKILAGGEPLPVILDDALAGSDPERAQRMSTVLFRSAKTLQIILLTCDLERYRRLGCPIGQVVDLENELRHRPTPPVHDVRPQVDM